VATSKVIFLQTDIMTGGQWIDKAALICKEADAAGRAPGESELPTTNQGLPSGNDPLVISWDLKGLNGIL